MTTFTLAEKLPCLTDDEKDALSRLEAIAPPAWYANLEIREDPSMSAAMRWHVGWLRSRMDDGYAFGPTLTGAFDAMIERVRRETGVLEFDVTFTEQERVDLYSATAPFSRDRGWNSLSVFRYGVRETHGPIHLTGLVAAWIYTACANAMHHTEDLALARRLRKLCEKVWVGCEMTDVLDRYVDATDPIENLRTR